MDTAFLTELRDWSDRPGAAFGDRAERARDDRAYQAAEVADLAARTCADLRALCDRRLGGERAGLVRAVTEAELRQDEANARFGACDRAAATAHARHFLTGADRERIAARARQAEEEAEAADEAVAAARAALQAFDAAVRGEDDDAGGH